MALPHRRTKKRAAKSTPKNKLIQETNYVFSSIIRNSDDGIITKDLDGTITGWNPAAERIYGYKSKEVVGKNISIILPKNKKEELKKLLTGIRLGKHFERFETQRRRKDGKIIDVSLWISPLKNERGRIFGASILSRDITQIKKTEHELLASEVKYLTLLESLNEGVWVIDAKSHTTYVNKVMCDLLGYSSKEMMGKHLFSFMDAAGVRICKKNLARRRKGIAEDHDFEFLKKNSSRLYASLKTAPLLDSGGKYAGAIAAVTDITEQKLAKDKIEELSRFPSENPFPIIRVSKDHRIIYLNKPAARLIRLSEGDKVPTQLAKHVTFAFSKGRTLTDVELQFGDKIYSWVINPIKGEDYANIYGSDLTELKKRTDVLRIQGEVIENMSEGVYIIGLDDVIIKYANPKFEKMFGYRRRELVGKHASIVNDPAAKDPIKRANEIMREIRRVGEWHGEVQNVKKDGTPIWCYANVSTFNHPEYGKTLIAVHSDISAAKKAEEHALKSASKYQELFKSSRDAIMTLEPPTWQFTSCNPATLKMFNVKSFTKFVTLGPWELSPKKQPGGKSSSNKSKQMIKKAMKVGSSLFDWTHKTLNGKEFPATVLLTRVEIEKGKPFLQATVRDVSSRKKIEDELLISRERFELAMRGAQDGLWDWNIITNEVYFSPRWKGMIGYAPDEIADNFSEWEKLLHPEDRESTLKYVMDYVKSGGGGRFRHEFRMRHKKGHYVPILARAFMVNRKDGKPVRLVGTHTDMTLIKSAQKKVADSEYLFRELFDNMRSGVAIYETKDGGKTFLLTDINNSGARISNVIKEKVIGKEASEVFSGLKQMGLYDIITDVWKTGKPRQQPLSKYTGNDVVLWLEIYVYKLLTGEIVTVYADLTETIKSTEAVRNSEERLRDFLDNASDMIQSINNKGEFLLVNKKWIDTLGYKQDEIPQLTLKDIVLKSEVEHCMQSFKIVKEGGAINGVETVFISKDGREIPVEGNVNCDFKEGKCVATRGIFRDVTERKKSQELILKNQQELQKINRKLFELNEKLQKANKELKELDKVKELDRMKDEFLSITTHELKTPLTPIKIQSQMLMAGKYGQINDKQLHSFEIILRNTTRLVRLIDDVMTIAKIDQQKLEFHKEPENLMEILKNIVSDMQMDATVKGLYLRTDVPEDLPRVFADRARIQQVIADLINNAIKFTEHGGITVGAKKQDDNVLVWVKDTGIGIPKGELKKVFQRFYQVDHTITRKYGGSGLGLSIVQNIIEEHGGQVWCESELGVGSTFYFTLPIDTKQVQNG